MYQPSLYAQTNVVSRIEAEFFLEKTLAGKKFAKNCKVLDVGSADGSVTEILLRFLPGDFAKLVGVDVSRPMVDFANSRKGDARVDFRVKDALVRGDLEEMFGEFDYVFSFFCLNWIQDQSLVLKNFYDLLKPGGQVYIVILSDSSTFRVFEIQSTNPKWVPYMKQMKEITTPYLRAENPEKLVREHLERAGFQVEIADALERKHVYPTEEELKRFVNSVNAFTPHMPPEVLEEYLADFVEKLQELDYGKALVKNEEKSKTLAYQILHVVATKPM